MLFAGGEMERAGHLQGKDRDICCGGLEKEMGLVVWELW